MEIPFKLTTPDCGASAFTELSYSCRTQTYQEIATDFHNMDQTHPALKLILGKSSCVFWILDVRSMQYPFVSSNSKKILGYEAQLFQSQGPAFFNQIAHPEDLAHYWVLNKQIWDFLVALEPWQRPQYTFNCDYRLRQPDNSYIRVLEKYSVLQTDGKGNITHLLGTGIDISSWKQSTNMIASLVSTEDNTCLFCTPEEPLNRTQNLLSKRELEVVQLLAVGLSSKHIAEKLNISYHTVNTHRQNMIEKTHSLNTGGLVQFAMSHGLI